MSADHVLTDAERSAGILTPEVMWKIKRVGSAVLSPDGRTVLYTVTTYDMKENKGVTNIRSAPVSGGKWIRVTDPGSNESSPQWSADGRTIYFISDHGGSDQVWCAAPDGNNRRQVTDISGGVEGFSVAPSENRLMYVARVPVEKRSSPEIYPDLDRSKAKIYDDLMERHWNYWDDGSYRHIFIAPLTGGAKVTGGTDIMPGEPWDAPTAPYFDISEIAWNRAGTQLAYTCKKLTGKAYALSTDSDVYLYDLASGQTRNLTEGMPGYDKYPVFSPDDSMLAFTSMERAGNESDKSRLFVETLATGEKRYLTRNFDYNAGNVRWDGNGTLYFIAPVRGTYQVCRVDLADDSVRVLTAGAHDVNAITLNGGELVGEVTSLSAPTELFRIDPADGTMTRITNTNPEIYDHIRMGEVRERWIRTTDGRQMLTWVVLPPDFDSTERYPALLYCQGGPQSGGAGIRGRRTEPARRAFVRTAVAGSDFGRLQRAEYTRLPERDRRCGRGTVGGRRPVGLRRGELRRIFGVFSGRASSKTLQSFYSPLRDVQSGEHVRGDRGTMVSEQRSGRSVLERRHDGAAVVCQFAP